MLDNDNRVYFIAETKYTGSEYVDLAKLHGDEQSKIKCTKAHYKKFEGLEYKVVRKVSQLCR